MGERVRSGPFIPQLAALQHGDHFCSFYDSPREQISIVAPFLKEAFRRGEACLYVADDRTIEEVTDALSSLGVNTRMERERGALVFVSRSEWRPTGDFDLQRMRAGVQALVARCLAPGFSGLWVAVDMTWTLHPNVAPQDVAEWESLLNVLLIQLPVVLLCQYSRSRLPADTLHQELRTHPMAILGERVYPNFFYESPDVYLNKSAHWQRLDWMFSQLRDAATLEEERAQRIRSNLMLQEVHHQVKNSMQIAASLLSLQAAKVEDPASRAILWETEARIRTIATVHAKLYATDMERKLDFAEYLQEFLPSRVLAYEDDPYRIRIEVVGSGLFLDSEAALPCALIVNELVTNAVKYAFPANRPGAIRVEVAALPGGQAAIIIRDNGVGFPHGVDVHNADTLGLQLVNALARQIHGVLHLDQPAGHPGATFRLHFPTAQ